MTELAYKFNPAGHEMPEENRKYANNDRLEALFQKWLKEPPVYPYKGGLEERMYQIAKRLLKDETFDANAVHTLVAQEHARNVTRPEEKLLSVDSFAAAAYNKAEDSVITFDAPTTPVRIRYSSVGYKLTKGKTLINKTEAVDLGFSATGTIINYARVWTLCQETRGHCINYGKFSPDRVAYGCKGLFVNCADMPDEPEFRDTSREEKGIGYLAQGPIINFGNTPLPEKNWNKYHALVGKGASSLVISNTREKDASGNITRRNTLWAPIPLIGPRIGEVKLDDCDKIPELANYLSTLRARFEEGRTDPAKAIKVLESLGPKPGQRVAEDITAILKRCLL